MSNVTHLFPIKIYQTTYPGVSDLKNKLFPKLDSVWDRVKSNNQEFMRGEDNFCSYLEEEYIHKTFPDETNDFVNFATEEAKKYWKELDYYEGLEPFVAQMWANKTPKGGWIESHLHMSIPFTGVLYVDASPEQGNLILENPLDTVLSVQPVNYKKKYQFQHEISVNTGDFILFPAYLRHRVLANTIDKDRLILGINFGSKGWYWQANLVNVWADPPSKI
jgi:uncharacterized protein (TIGR02466 family)